MRDGLPVLLVAHNFGGDYDHEGKWIPNVGTGATTGPDEWPIESFALLQGGATLPQEIAEDDVRIEQDPEEIEQEPESDD